MYGTAERGTEQILYFGIGAVALWTGSVFQDLDVANDQRRGGGARPNFFRAARPFSEILSDDQGSR